MAAAMLVVLLVAAPGLPSTTPATDLQEGIALYWSGEYQRTIETLSGVCDQSRRHDESVECLKYLAFSHVAIGDAAPAQSAFRKLLLADPAHVLETGLVSPKIVRQFEAARASLVTEAFERGKSAYFAESFDEARNELGVVLKLDAGHPLATEYLALLEEKMAIAESARAAEAAPAPPPVEEPDEDRVYHVTGQIVPPVLSKRVSPDYPISARRAGVQGTVVATIVIGTDGTVAEARIVRGLSRDIDREALEAVRRWTYEPARMDDRPVAVYSVVRLSFALDP